MQTGLRFFLAKGDLKSFMDKAYEQLQKIPKKYLFPPRSLNIFKELPLYYTVEGQIIYGIIDQLTLGQNWVRIVDYKTENQGKLKNKHIVQLELYALGIKKIRASKNIEAGILFLKSGEFKTIAINQKVLKQREKWLVENLSKINNEVTEKECMATKGEDCFVCGYKDICSK